MRHTIILTLYLIDSIIIVAFFAQGGLLIVSRCESPGPQTLWEPAISYTQFYDVKVWFNLIFLLLLGLGADPNKPPCKKAKQLRLERKQQRLAQRQQTAAENAGKTPEIAGKETGNAGKASNEPKSLEEFIVDALPGQEPKHRLEVS